MPTACALVLASVLTASAPSSPALEADLDLDGDGKRERVTLAVTKPGAFRLSAGKVLIEGELPGVKGFTVLDLDNGDKRREVLVQGEAEGAARFRLFRQEGAALQEVPLPPGTPSASGNGILLSDVPMADGWSRRDKYLYDAKKPGFTEVPQELHAVGLVLPSPHDVELQRVPGSAEVVAVASASRSLSLHAFKPDPGDKEGGWYLANVADVSQDALGWLPASALRKAPPAAPSAAASTTKVLPELYALGLKPRVATSLPLLRTRLDDAETVAKLRAGSTITLLATDGGWYLVQSETRLLGWARAGTLAKSLAGQLLVLQLRLRAVMGATPSERQPWLPSGSGLILNHESAGAYETYHLCPDGRGALAFLVDDHTKYGTWTLDGDTLKLEFTRETRREGVGEPQYPPEGQEGLPSYSEYRNSEGAIEESASLSWAEVLEDMKNPSPYFFSLVHGTPTCR